MKRIALFSLPLLLTMCQEPAPPAKPLAVTVYETSAAGNRIQQLDQSVVAKGQADTLKLNPTERYQEITGFGGAFTESTCYLLNQLGEANKKQVMDAYFSETGANYSLARTHMNSCDFSLDHYSYAEQDGDLELEHFTIEHDQKDIIPVIKEAQEISKDGFKIIASPWTAPPWMKDNKTWNGGKLLEEYYPTWALFFAKYAQAYQQEGIDIWGFTVENEPLGNNSNWESMHYTPEEMGAFVKGHLGPVLQEAGLEQKILIYDQNRDHELQVWVDALLKDPEVLPYVYGTAVHWYQSTIDWGADALNYAHEVAPDKHIIHTEACVDAEVPVWKDDSWYWKKEATDWGWDWASDEDKPNHPKYVPVYRYARDIIGCMNSWVEGWIDWNMVLDKQGGPNLAKNWCIAPVIVDHENDEVYFTPLYDVMTHFSRFIRPGATRIGWSASSDQIMQTAVENPDGSIAVVVLNTGTEARQFIVELNGKTALMEIGSQALQTLVIPAENE